MIPFTVPATTHKFCLTYLYFGPPVGSSSMHNSKIPSILNGFKADPVLGTGQLLEGHSLRNLERKEAE